MYTSASGYIIDYSELKWSIYTDIVVSFVHVVIGICGISGAYFLLTHIHYTVAIKSCSLLSFWHAVMWGLHEDYIIRAVGTYICELIGIFV